MKKLLALVLALVMTLSLCVTSNAAFADAADIEHDEAVEMMNALGVINGKPDGKFDPKGNVTRAEMAKMITIVMLGDVDAAAFVGTSTDLKDVNGHWAEGYIKYCYSQGVIAGKGNGVFDPNANVTAVEAAKMLLVAIGFDAKIQEYTGADWAINVTRDAQLKGFYDELKGLSASKVLSRDEAAQMIWNAVQAVAVKISKGWNSVDNKITYNYNDTAPLLVSTFGAKTDENVTFQNSEMQLTGDNKGTYTVNGTYTKVAADYSDLLGQTVTVVYYDKNKDGDYDTDEKIFNIFAKYDNAATELIAQSAFEKSADKKVKANGTTYTLDDASIDWWTVTVGGVVSDAGSINATTIATNNSIDLLRLVDTDGDGDYDRVVEYVNTFAKVTYVDTKKVIAGADTYKYEDYTIAEGLAKKDFVAINWNFTTGKTALTEVEKQTGKVTATKTDYAKVDGGEWVYTADALTIDQTYDFYVLNGVVIDNTQTTAVALTSLVFVTGVDPTGLTGTTARVYFTDGTNKVVDVDTTSTGAVAPDPDRFYTIKETSNGVKFTECDGGRETPDEIFTDYTYDDLSDVDAPAGKITTINSNSIADDAVIFVHSGSNTTAKVITGKELKTLDAEATTDGKIDTAGVGSFSKTVNGLTKVTIAAVWYQDADPDTWANWNITADADNYALVTSAPIVVASNYHQYSIWNGTENVTVIDKNNSPAKFSVVAYSGIDADGYIKDVSVKAYNGSAYSTGANEYASAALTGFETTKTGYDLTLDGASVVATDKDTIFWSINSASSTADGIGLNKLEAADAIVLADKVYDEYCQNVIVYTGTSGVADVVIFDGSNRLATAAATQYTFTITGTTSATGVKVKDIDGNELVSGTSKVKAGDLLTIEISGTTTNLSTTNAGDVTDVTSPLYEDFNNETVANGQSYIVVVKDDVTVTVD